MKESERKKNDLSVIMENSAALQALVEGSEAQLEDRLFELNEDWQRVHTLIEDWLSAVLVSVVVIVVLVLQCVVKGSFVPFVPGNKQKRILPVVESQT